MILTESDLGWVIVSVLQHALFMKEASDGRRLRQRIMDVLEKLNCPSDLV